MDNTNIKSWNQHLADYYLAEDLFDIENNKELDPYGEENWNEKAIEIDREKLIRDIVSDIVDDPYNWKDWLEDHLIDYFRRMELDDLKDFYNIEDEMCDECNGSGENLDGTPCDVCNGTGEVDGYINRYGIK